MTRPKKLQLIREELAEFQEEFDVSDPDWTQILFKKHVSSLINRGVLKTRRLPRKVRLIEIIELVGLDDDREIVDLAEQFDEVLQAYGEGPSKDEMREGLRSLGQVLVLLEKIIEPHEN
jgi:hypothetical protein